MFHIHKNLKYSLNFFFKNVEKAISHYTKSLDFNPVSVAGYCNRSAAYYKLQSFILIFLINDL